MASEEAKTWHVQAGALKKRAAQLRAHGEKLSGPRRDATIEQVKEAEEDASDAIATFKKEMEEAKAAKANAHKEHREAREALVRAAAVQAWLCSCAR